MYACVYIYTCIKCVNTYLHNQIYTRQGFGSATVKGITAQLHKHALLSAGTMSRLAISWTVLCMHIAAKVRKLLFSLHRSVSKKHRMRDALMTFTNTIEQHLSGGTCTG